ncbi:nucleoid-associated protein [Glaciimonas soli]|uniref:Nucleoid-associated protein n=1 Tax=Glaciimonas soli TaxID=2590999 RepID=A0A843Z0H3_9BURK|nr:nucleoid-associated protein [Glaciimonas soli]MQR02336.1 hypothetical protein [Glaciimonas soli]
MQIIEAVIHGIKKEKHKADVTEQPNDKTLPIDELLKKLCEDVLKIYAKTTNNYGTLSADDVYYFPHAMEKYYEKKSTAVVFTKEVTHLIAIEMKKSSASNGGYVLFLRYDNQGRDWLLVVMLKLTSRTGINENTLELNDSISFDLEHLHEAARIDIEKWRTNEQPYLSFIKRSSRTDDVTQYFRNALACTDYTDSKSHTTQALDAIKAYCLSQEFTPEQTRQVRRAAYDHFDNKWNANESVNLITLSAIINNGEPQSFLDFVKEKQYTINEQFSPHKKTFSRYKRIQGEFGTVKISFEANDLLTGAVNYDAKKKILTIKDISQKLANDIKDATGDTSSDGSS